MEKNQNPRSEFLRQVEELGVVSSLDRLGQAGQAGAEALQSFGAAWERLGLEAE